MVDVHQMLLGGPTAFDYFLKGQSAQQNFNANQQQMQARDQAMQQAAQMNPMLLKAQQAGIDLTEQQTEASGVTQQLNQFNLDTARESKAQAKQIKSFGNLAVLGDDLRTKTKEGSPERQQMFETLRPQIEQIIADGEIDIDPSALADGLSDEEIDGFIQQYKMIRPQPKPMSAKEAAEIEIKRGELGVKRDELGFKVDELAEERRQFNKKQSMVKTDEQKIEHEVNIQTAKDLAKRKSAKIAEAPMAIKKGKGAIELIDKIFSHKGKSNVVGNLVTPSKYVPGTESHDFMKLLDQLKGKAFMQAYMDLKGGGSITEIETQNAVTSLLQAATSQSPEAFDEALNEFRDDIISGVHSSQEVLEQEPLEFSAPQSYEPPRQVNRRGRSARSRPASQQAPAKPDDFDDVVNKYLQ